MINFSEKFMLVNVRYEDRQKTVVQTFSWRHFKNSWKSIEKISFIAQVLQNRWTKQSVQNWTIWGVHCLCWESSAVRLHCSQRPAYVGRAILGAVPSGRRRLAAEGLAAETPAPAAPTVAAWRAVVRRWPALSATIVARATLAVALVCSRPLVCRQAVKKISDFVCKDLRY